MTRTSRNYKPAQRKAPPAVKQYVKRAIEAKRDAIIDCNFTSQGIGYDTPLILNLTPNVAKSQGQDIDFHNLNLWISLSRANTTFYRILVVQWFQDSQVGAPTIAEVMCSAASAQSVMEGYNQAHHKQKFVVLKDKLVVNTANKNDGTSVMKMRVPKKSLQRKVFRSTGGGEYKNELYLIAFTESLVSSPATIQVGSEYSFKNRD